MVIINIMYWNWDSIPLHANFIFKLKVFVISEVLRKLPYRSKCLLVLVDCVLVTSGEKSVNLVKNCSKLELNIFLCLSVTGRYIQTYHVKGIICPPRHCMHNHHFLSVVQKKCIFKIQETTNKKTNFTTSIATLSKSSQYKSLFLMLDASL